MAKQERNFKDKLEHWEISIRQGLAHLVRKEIKALVFSRIPRYHKLKVAQLARRAGSTHVALAILNPVLRPEMRHLTDPSNAEKAEYAAGLLEIGARKEADKVLNEVATDQSPESLLYQSFSLFSRWDYETSLPLLEQYVWLEQDPYRKLVGMVNLAAARIGVAQFQVANRILAEVSAQAHAKNHVLILSICSELAAQSHILSGQYSKGQAALQLARDYDDPGSAYHLLIEKWELILALKRDGASSQLRHKFKTLKRRALNISHWETLREIDYYLSIESQDRKLFTNVFFGTPYRAYRNRMLEEMPKNWLLPPQFIYGGDSGAQASQPYIDVVTAMDESGRLALKPGQVMHRLIYLITRDFYRPVRVGFLFSELFPNEFYNPITSPDRVYQAIRRLRHWTQEQKIPIEILENDGAYGFHLQHGFAIRVHQYSKPLSVQESYLNFLVQTFPQGEFTASKARTALNISRSAFGRWIQWAVSGGYIRKVGKASRSRYGLVSPLNHQPI